MISMNFPANISWMTKATWSVAVTGNKDYTIHMYTEIGCGTIHILTWKIQNLTYVYFNPYVDTLSMQTIGLC